MGEISLLLGAGFSVNKGYPTANQLNDSIINIKEHEFSISSDGTFFFLNGRKDYFANYPQSNDKAFFIEFIQFYLLKNKNFNYEVFYDYYHKMYREEEYDSEFTSFCDSFRDKHSIEDSNNTLLSRFNKNYNQAISSLLTDEEGQQYYQPIHHCKSIYPGYSGFLYSLEHFGNGNTVHIHTLNHDLFFESLNSSDWINGELTDGFQELGSPYYGSLDEKYTVRLRYFSQKYDSKFRLYKLHGSVDQYPFNIQRRGIDTYIKTKYGIDSLGFLKEVRNENDELTYISDWINYHSDFLSGTTSKILRYREPLYYNIVFEHFERNLSNSDKLIIVGYGCGDTEVNEIIDRHFKKGNPIYVVNPYPNEHVHHFCGRFNAKLIQRGLEELSLNDFQ